MYLVWLVYCGGIAIFIGLEILNMDQYFRNQYLVVQAALRKIEETVPEFDSTSLKDYLEWEFDVEQCIYEFPHSSRQVEAIIEKKLT